MSEKYTYAASYGQKRTSTGINDSLCLENMACP